MIMDLGGRRGHLLGGEGGASGYPTAVQLSRRSESFALCFSKVRSEFATDELIRTELLNFKADKYLKFDCDNESLLSVVCWMILL